MADGFPMGFAMPDDGVRVLLVEDEPAVADMYRIRLERDGYRVDLAPDARSALESARTDPPDLIFLDIRLPDVDGLTLLRHLRQDEMTRFVPVIILTAYSAPELVERGLRLGALEFLVKSETVPGAVAERVAMWLEWKPLEAADLVVTPS